MRGAANSLRLPTRAETLKTLAAAALVALICFYFGVDVWHALLLGCAITVTALASLAGSSAPDARELNWRHSRRTRREGSRSEIANLATSLRGGWGFIGLTAQRQLMQIARRRLALEGLELSNQEHRSAIEERIGARAYSVLANPAERVPRLRTLQYCLDMLDAIDSTHYPVPLPRSRRWDPREIPFRLRRARDR